MIEELLIITKGKILSLIITFSLIAMLANVIVWSAAETLCEDTAEKPFRYESQGLFGKLVKIETTEQNADGYAQLCIKSGSPSFWSVTENIDYILKIQKESSP